LDDYVHGESVTRDHLGNTEHITYLASDGCRRVKEVVDALLLVVKYQKPTSYVAKEVRPNPNLALEIRTEGLGLM
jgi:hypothetical protein